jgi:heavy metal sensor kinase
MKNWWKERSLRLRLTAWYTVVATGILLGLTPVVYALIEHRLHLEFDRQLRIDSILVEPRIATELTGKIQERSEEMTDGRGAVAAWFEVWSREGRLLLRHWPIRANAIRHPLPPPGETGERFATVELDNQLPVRMIERLARLGERDVMMRVFRDESGLHRMLWEILIGFALGAPVAALLSALGGYVMAGRTLAPLGAMAEQARRITSESLSQRLPNPNPHDELGQLAAVFNQTLERLQSSFEALKRFTSDASHELRTPLTALCTVGEVGLRRANEPAALRETIGSMLEEAQRLRDLTDSLLLLTRVESEPKRPPSALVPLEKLLEDVRDSLQVLAAEKRQTLELQADPDVTAFADRLLLHQALMNIVHNAIRYSPPRTLVRISCHQHNHSAVIEVADQGPGIAPEYQPKIFERFFRIDKARSAIDGGAGLGLAIAKLSIERQAGRIELESVVGQGSLFRVVLLAPSGKLESDP